jgi:fumarate reductase flavoprotein subunit
MDKINRRSFLKAAAIGTAGAASAGLLNACAPKVEETAVPTEAVSAGVETGATPSFMLPPKPITDDKIVETIECDVVVVGAGISGVPAAAIAAELGSKVYCLEKSGNIVTTRPTGFSLFGTQKLKDLGVLCTEKEKKTILTDIWGGANGTSKEEVVRAWLDNSGAYGDWLFPIIEASGIPVKVGGYYGYYKHFDTVQESQEDMKKTGGVYSDSYWNMYALQHQVGESNTPGVCLWGRPDLSDADWLTPVYQYAVDKGCNFVFNCKAEQLIREPGWEKDNSKRITGVIATNKDGKYVKYIAKKGVVLATGGFDWNDEMVQYYYPIGLRTCRTWQKWMTGDGHRMSMWVGAKMEDPGQYVSHMMGTIAPAVVMRSKDMMMKTEREAFIIPWKEWALPSNALAPTLKVNQKGERFFNEEVGYFMSGPIIDKQPNGLFWAFWDGNSEKKVIPHYFDRIVDGIDTDQHSELMVQHGLLIKADTIDDLIKQMNGKNWDDGAFDGETFKKTLAHYNEMCAAGEDADYYKPTMFMSTVDTPPFYAAEMGSSWMTTVGGLEIDKELHVLGMDRKPIPGLYAGGNPAGCFYGNIYAPQVPMSLSGHSMTLSWLAAKNCVNAI